MFTACCTFLLLIAGALVTSNDAGLSVPDWPTSFGSFRMPPMVGGVKFEHGHRMVAGFVVILSLALTIWTFFADRRSWMRKLLVAAMASVVAQAVLGGLTVLFFLPPWVSTAHATLAQTFFCLLVAAALFSGRGWIEGAPRQVAETRRPRLATLTLVTAAAVYLQLILGAAFRHSAIKLMPHLIEAAVVSVLVLWTVTRVLTDYGRIAALRRPAVLLLAVLLVQLGLGFGSFLTKVDWGKDAPQPMLSMVVVTVAHVAVGALLLAASMVLAIQTRRHVVSAPDPVPSAAQKAVTA
ncbi:MAG TPA: COX15/CtaA family protein [Terriglobales bacterium]|nr:COX15/CtaA family protein [Terriglobales bacterium]